MHCGYVFVILLLDPNSDRWADIFEMDPVTVILLWLICCDPCSGLVVLLPYAGKLVVDRACPVIRLGNSVCCGGLVVVQSEAGRRRSGGSQRLREVMEAEAWDKWVEVVKGRYLGFEGEAVDARVGVHR
jgi:hypothetical protein